MKVFFEWLFGHFKKPNKRLTKMTKVKLEDLGHGIELDRRFRKTMIIRQLKKKGIKNEHK
jgi:hypothetical protein